MIKLNIYVLISMILFTGISGCIKHNSSIYLKYSKEDNIVLYRDGISKLTDMISRNNNRSGKMSALNILGIYTKNNNPGAREAIVELAVPELVAVYNNEEDPIVRAKIVEVLGLINTSKEIVVELYIRALNSEWRYEAFNAIDNLLSIGVSMSEYTIIFENKLSSEDPYIVEFGLDALGMIGEDNEGLIEKIKMIISEDSRPSVVSAAIRAMERIQAKGN